MTVKATTRSLPVLRIAGFPVLLANIDELQNTGLSIMPEGQEKLISKQEMADVIAYLLSIE